MIEERVPPDDGGDTILSSAPPPQDPGPELSSLWPKVAAIIFVLVAGIAGGYGWLQHNTVQQMAAERADLRASLAQAKSQADALTAKVNAMAAAQAQADALRAQAETAKNEQFPPQTEEKPRRVAHRAPVRRAPADDPRWKQVQEQLASQQNELTQNQKLIADTQASLDQAKSDLQGNLDSARSELGNDIARNHTELVALEKKGERNYYEFSFEKSKNYHHAGPISIALHKADNKHEYCDLALVVDDKEMTRKHVNLYESVTLYPEGYPLPIEVVVNHIDKDSIQGYVSEPKYKPTPVAAAPSAATAASVTTPPAPTGSDVKLDHRPTDDH